MRAATNVFELHPEELIDLEARGALDPIGAARLEAHRARCVACRYERSARVQFATALAEPDLEPRPSDDESPRRRTSKRGRWIWAAVALTVVAAAHLAAPPAEPTRVGRIGHVAVTERTARAPSSATAVAARARVVVVSAPAPSGPMPTAAMLFERATAARHRGEYERALAIYRNLQRRYPSSLEARVSFVAMGRMQLDRGDGAGALASFERYEAWGNGDVDAVVMAGRALALDELGAEDSTLAWAELLASHPETPYAEHARRRVAARSL